MSFLKANRAQDGHPGNSSPLDEQLWLTDTLNNLQSLPEWNETAVFIAWDDSDGWYDHVMGPIINQSTTTADALTGAGAMRYWREFAGGLQARCGYGPRIPLVIVSPYAKENYVDNTLTTRAPSFASSKTIGGWDGLAVVRSTRSPARSTPCSTSTINGTIGCF